MKNHMLGQLKTRALAFLVLLVLPLVMTVTAAPPSAFAQGGATLVIDAPRRVQRGEPIKIELTIRNAGDIAGYEMNVLYDTAAAHLYGIHQRDNDLKKMGRDVVPLVANREEDGGVAIGLASCAVGDCVSGQGARQQRGGQGNFKLGTLLVGTDQEGPLEIKFDAAKFVDAQGNPVDVRLSKQSVTVQVGRGGGGHPAPASRWQLSQRAPQTPNNAEVKPTGRTQIGFADVMEMALAWTTTREVSSPCGDLPEPALDVNRDGCIDVADVQLVIARSGRRTAQAPSQATAKTWVVNTTNDSADTTPGDGVCNASGGCTLRAAIDESNLSPGPDTIVFNIPLSGVLTINLKTNLPTLSDASGPMTIDGYTQPGASPNTDPLASNAVILIQLKGTGPSSFDAFRISTAGNLIRGLSLYNLRRPFYLYGSGAANNYIVGNIIGTDAAAQFLNTTSIVNANGVHIESGANNNHIGTPNLADRNVISGNSRHGIGTYFEGTNNNVFQNNIIGLSPLGDRNVKNMKHGIDINGASSFNLIGGTGPNERNIISGDGDPSDDDYSAGTEISHDTSTVQNKILGNCYGTDLTCNSGPDYARLSHYGIRLEDGVNNNEVAFNVIGNTKQGGVQLDNFYTAYNKVHDNRIGISANGTAIPNAFFGVRVKYHGQHMLIGPNNIITNNPSGVIIEYNDEDFNTITQNSIYGNSFTGIDLGPGVGVAGNDSGDTDTGANEGLNYPVLSSATTTQVKGTACGDAVVPKPCTVEIFIAQPDANNSGGGQYGQGKTLVGTGTSNGSFTIAVSGVQVGDFLTATATDAQGNTSEFSKNRQVTADTNPTPTSTSVPPTATTAPTTGPTNTPVSGPTDTPTTVPPTDTPTSLPPTATPAPPTATPTSSGPAVLAQDLFERTNANGWGSATIGGAWSLSGAQTSFDVNGSEGTIRAPITNTTRSAYLLNVTGLNVDETIRVKTNKLAEGGSQIAYFVARHISTNTHYLGRIRFAANGTMHAQAVAEVNGAQTLLGGEKVLKGVPQTADTYYWLRGQVVGTNPTTINLKIWMDGQPEPASWLYTVTDSTPELQAPGSVGLRIYLATQATNPPVLFTFDDFLVQGLP